MDNNTQMSPAKANKIVMVIVAIAVVAAAVMGLWWMLRSGEWFQSSPAAESDSDLNELDSINADQDIDAEFQQIDQDINNL